jgi:hypothetical protein
MAPSHPSRIIRRTFGGSFSLAVRPFGLDAAEPVWGAGRAMEATRIGLIAVEATRCPGRDDWTTTGAAVFADQ